MLNRVVVIEFFRVVSVTILTLVIVKRAIFVARIDRSQTSSISRALCAAIGYRTGIFILRRKLRELQWNVYARLVAQILSYLSILYVTLEFVLALKILSKNHFTFQFFDDISISRTNSNGTYRVNFQHRFSVIFHFFTFHQNSRQ